MVKAAVPLMRGRSPEIGVVPSKKMMVPVAEAGATLAENVSAAPIAAGLAPAVREMLILALGLVTACVSAELTDAPNVLFPV